MSPPRVGRTQDCGPREAATRLAQALKMYEAAELVAGEDEIDESLCGEGCCSLRTHPRERSDAPRSDAQLSGADRVRPVGRIQVSRVDPLMRVVAGAEAEPVGG